MFRNFIKKHKSHIVFLGDICIFFSSLALTIYIRYGYDLFKTNFDFHLHPFSILLLLWVFVFYAADLYSYTSWRTSYQNIRKFIIAFCINFFISTSMFYAFGNFFELTPKLNLVIFSGIFFIFDAVWRFSISRLLSSKNNKKTVAVFTTYPLVGEIISHCNKHKELGYTIKILTNLDELKKITSKDKVIILIDSSYLKNPDVSRVLYEMLAEHIEIKTLTEFYEEVLGRIPLSEVKEEWFIQEIKSDKSIYESIKRGFDVTFAIVFIIAFSPLFIIFFILIPITSTGPAIYKQKRVGRDDKIFTIYKFRNMYSEIEKNPDSSGATPIWWQNDDSRVTPLGKFLRKTHFDELPQLFNILKGDMSVVGPRPERPEFVEILKKDIPHYFMRQTVTPGLTGWAQIMFRYASTVNEQLEKFKFDLYYIKNRTTFLDLAVIIKTIRLIFSK
jgi:exopolysaccharide biosynthesis polyprenyl glycosylphosphotransferase